MKKFRKILAVVLIIFSIGCCLTMSKAVSSPQVVVAAVIKRGDSGSTVRTIQTKLKNWGYYKGGIDGVFGTQTFNAVKYFQRVCGAPRACVQARGI